MATTRRIHYSDIHRKFGEDEKDLQVHNVEAINEHLSNILEIGPGEIMFNRGLGISLQQFLYEPITPLTTRKISDLVFDFITESEPRISVVPRLSSVIPAVDEYSYHITVQYVILATGETGNFETTMLREGNQS